LPPYTLRLHLFEEWTEEQVDALEKYISEFGKIQQPDAAAQASTVDLHKELEG
jgi:hypothetical protein